MKRKGLTTEQLVEANRKGANLAPVDLERIVPAPPQDEEIREKIQYVHDFLDKMNGDRGNEIELCLFCHATTYQGNGINHREKCVIPVLREMLSCGFLTASRNEARIKELETQLKWARDCVKLSDASNTRLKKKLREAEQETARRRAVFDSALSYIKDAPTKLKLVELWQSGVSK